MLIIEKKNELASLITYNFRNLQEFESERKRTLFLWSRNFKLLCTPAMILLPEESKLINTVSLFKIDVKQWICKEFFCRLCKVFLPSLRFISNMVPIFAL